MKKIFITGGGGMLASAIEQFYRHKQMEVLACSHKQLDITNQRALADAIANFRPEYVFHTAALHVNDCEENPELAFKINSWASRNLARICQKNNAALIYIGSSGYFGDEIKYYSEYDPVVLKTVYARSKYLGEIAALEECKNTFAIRAGWLFGGSIQHKKNFVYQRYLEANSSMIVKSANDKYGCPTFISDLVLKIDEILKEAVPGTYHLTNSGGCSRFEYVQKIVQACGLKTEVAPVDSSAFSRKANIASCELLNNLNLKFAGLAQMPPWQEAIERYVRIMFKELKC